MHIHVHVAKVTHDLPLADDKHLVALSPLFNYLSLIRELFGDNRLD